MKKKYLTTGIFIGIFFLCAAIVGAAVRFFPLLRAAQTVRRVLSAECMEYDIHVTLNQEQFSGKQEQFLRAVSWILETDESACLSWEVGGKISDGQGYAQIFCEGLDGPVTDVYFDKNDIWVNVKMLYEALQNNFTSAHPLLGHLLPDWNYSDYMSLEQMEEIVQTDIKGMYLPDMPKGASGQSTWQYIVMLSQLERKKTEDGRQQFSMDWKDYQIAVEIGKQGRATSSDEQSDKAAYKPDIFIQGVDREGGRIVQSYEAEINAGSATKMAVPDSVMTQDEMEQFMKLWELVKGMQGEFGKERKA